MGIAGAVGPGRLEIERADRLRHALVRMVHAQISRASSQYMAGAKESVFLGRGPGVTETYATIKAVAVWLLIVVPYEHHA